MPLSSMLSLKLSEMASAFTHAIVGVALAQIAKPSWRRQRRFWGLVIFCSVLPDVDVVGFRFGIHYRDLWGHRGMTHSLLFAAITGAVVSTFLARSWRDRWPAALLLFVITAFHGVLDALTNGGLGVAFFSPFNTDRYFFSWQPIQVSPLAAHRFFSEWGLAILWSEIKSIWLPAILAGALLYGIGRGYSPAKENTGLRADC
jgi:inner membrane protein